MRRSVTTNTQSSYSTMPTEDDQLFYDEQIQRFDADTIRNRYGENWKNFASNVREVTQPDGSIIKEYIIEDPSLLDEIKPSSRPVDSTSSTTGSDDEQQSLKNKFAQIKAKFEQNNSTNVMASRSTTSSSSTNTTSTQQNTRKKMDDLYARHRRASNESIPNNNNNNNKRNSSNQSVTTPNSYFRSQSIGSGKSKTSSFRRFNSADEADEEVSRIHRQGEELRRHNQHTPSMSSSMHNIPQQSHSQYEIVDEDGNPMAIDGVQDLLKMSGVQAREVPQPDGTIIKEYVIDDPQLLSQFRAQQEQQQQSSSMTPSYIQQQSIDQDAPPPPPRIPLRPPILFRQGGSLVNDNLPYSIQEIHVLEPQRRYEYLTTTGRRIQFSIISSDSYNGQLLSDLDIRELTNAINLRLLPPSNPIAPPPPPPPTIKQQQGSFAQASFNLPKQWYPSVDLTHRQRLGSDNQPYANNSNTGFQPMQTDLSRSASSGALNQGSYYSQNQQQQPQIYHEPTNQWTRYQDSHNQRHQSNEPFQSSAQFLPKQQVTRSMHSPPIHTNPHSAFHQQSTTYPYQGQQQHGVRILNDFNQQRTAIVNDGNARI